MKQIKIQLQNKGKNTGYFELKNKDEKAELLIYGDISSDKWNSSDVTPKEIKDLLDEANGKELDIYINSSEGNVFAGIAIYSMLKRYSGVKNVYIDGLAASAASFIAMAGDTIIIPQNAYLMIHRAMTIAFGNVNDMHSAIEALEKTDNTIADIYMEKKAENEGIEKETFINLMDKETWLTGAEAVKYFNVTVGEASETAACIDEEYFNKHNVPEQLKNKIYNRKIEKEQDKSKIVNFEKEKLKLKLKLGGN